MMFLRFIRKLRMVQESGGAALIEFALVMPMLILLVAAVVQFGYIFYVQATMQNAVRTAARELSLAEVVNDASNGGLSGLESPDDPTTPISFDTSIQDWQDCFSSGSNQFSFGTAEWIACDAVSSLVGDIEVLATDQTAGGLGSSGDVSVVGLRVPYTDLFLLDPFGLLGQNGYMVRISIMRVE